MKSGQYLAFNRSIVTDARRKFPDRVNCSTIHSLAHKHCASTFSNEKLIGKLNTNQVVQILSLSRWQTDELHSLAPRSQGALILSTFRNFAHSDAPEPMPEHVPRHGKLLTASEDTLNVVRQFAVQGARQIWRQMRLTEGPVPLGFDGYLKLWALSDPIIATDYVLLDEAQDTNPVVLGVLTKQASQLVYVGDRYQQIYAWRGAVNAMEKIATDHTSMLTTSFRFGEDIARLATKVLLLLGESQPLRGNSTLTSCVGQVDGGTILARTNASTIGALIGALDEGRRPHLVGGSKELREMLKGVQDLKAGIPSTVEDFFGFINWNEVVDFAKSGEGGQLLSFVNLVEDRGEGQLLWALGQTVDEVGCDLVISTAHKAKGREWKKVKLMEDFLRTYPKKRDDRQPQEGIPPEELRLLYVAVTRAKEAVEVPEAILKLLSNQPARPSAASSP